MTIDQKEYLSTVEVAELIGRSPGAIRNMVMRRQIPFIKPRGLRLIFLRSEIHAWFKEAPGLKLNELEGNNNDC